jgi:hypothetical protein
MYAACIPKLTINQYVLLEQSTLSLTFSFIYAFVDGCGGVRGLGSVSGHFFGLSFCNIVFRSRRHALQSS